jgi:hypothetical protein
MVTEEQILETKLLPTQGMLRCIDENGDTKVIWDRKRRVTDKFNATTRNQKPTRQSWRT